MSGPPRFNEAVDEAGQLRPAYADFRARTGRDPLSVSGRRDQSAPAPLGGRFAILPVPLILEDEEYRETIARGVEQRALALQALFLDLVRGEPAVHRHTGLPVDLLDQVLRQAGTTRDRWRRPWDGKALDAVRFTCAPDLVRAPDGRWRVLEDNVGCVGGVVDGHLAAERVLAHLGASEHPQVPRGSDLARAVGLFLERVGVSSSSSEVMALVGPEVAHADSEESRKAGVLRDLGLRVQVGPIRSAPTGADPDARRLAAIVNFDLRGGPASELSDELFGRQGVALMTAPGVEVLGHKALLPFVDAIVKFYSGADPILPAAPTELFRGMPADPSGWVLKRGDGCQGEAVFFLDGLADAERSSLEARTSTWGDGASAVLQRRIAASILPESLAPETAEPFQVELRPLAFVLGAGACLAAEHACGRAFRNVDGWGLGNLSRGARCVGVIREPARPENARSITTPAGV